MILTEEVLQRYRANQGYVYLIHAVDTNRHKIGRSANPVARFETLKKQSPYPLQIIDCFWTPDAIEDESDLHKAYGEFRVHGEWFEFPDRNFSESSNSKNLAFWAGIKTAFSYGCVCKRFSLLAYVTIKQMVKHLEEVAAHAGISIEDKFYSHGDDLEIPVLDLIGRAKSIDELVKVVIFIQKDLVFIVSGSLPRIDACTFEVFQSILYSSLETASSLMFKRYSSVDDRGAL